MIFCYGTASRLIHWGLLPAKGTEPEACSHSVEHWDYKSKRNVKNLLSSTLILLDKIRSIKLNRKGNDFFTMWFLSVIFLQLKYAVLKVTSVLKHISHLCCVSFRLTWALLHPVIQGSRLMKAPLPWSCITWRPRSSCVGRKIWRLVNRLPTSQTGSDAHHFCSHAIDQG